MKLALIQINPRIGDFWHNTEVIINGCRRAAELGCELAVLPELAPCGYPPEDLLERPAFLAAHQRAMERLLREIKGIGVLCGTLLPSHGDGGKPLHNAAVLFADGEILATASKRLLPNYDIFDESRYFEPGPAGVIHHFRGVRLAITICEDVWNHVIVDNLVKTRQTSWSATRKQLATKRSQSAARLFATPTIIEQHHRFYHHDPVAELLGSVTTTGTGAPPADLLINIAASPFESGKTARREQIFQTICRRYRIPLLFVNQVGGQDSLIFDGNSLAMNPDGQIACRAARFREDLQVFTLPEKPEKSGRSARLGRGPGNKNRAGGATGEVATGHGDRLSEPENAVAGLPGADHDHEAAEILAALILGTGDFVRKCGFSKAVLGLSGGLDSALTAVIAARALGPANVLGLAMPSAYSAAASQQDARALAANLGLEYAVRPIDRILAAYRSELAPPAGNQPQPGQSGQPGESGQSNLPGLPGLVEQNLQARIRGNLLMAESNRSGRLLLNTGNKSELAVGYCTLYGDMCGALAVLADVPKTMVYRLAKLINREGEIIPRRTIERPPSAELAPGQRDDDDLPPYEVLDPILQAYLEEQLGAAEIIARGFPEPVVGDVIRRIHRNEHKRRQAPPGLKVTAKAFGSGRRYPLTAQYDDLARNGQ